MAVATGTGITTTVAAFLVPGWTLAAAVAAAALCGLNGEKRDGKPLITRCVATNVLRRLDSTEVFEALAAIGIEGRKGKRGVEFASEVMRDGPGWRAEVDLPPGVKATAVLEKREELAAAMRRPISTMWPEADCSAHPGRLVLWVAQRDPAKAGQKLWPLMKSGQADVYEPLPFGFDPRGNLVEITLMYSNLLVGGIPGSGMTSCALAIVLGVALDPTAELWIFELKGSGDLDSVRPVCHRYVSGDEDEDLEAALGGMRSGSPSTSGAPRSCAPCPPPRSPRAARSPARSPRSTPSSSSDRASSSSTRCRSCSRTTTTRMKRHPSPHA
ncbi:hypothetical protein [Streptomyces sp. UG1]|uniref:hypothetical protein n=1 Tax=Streptomyces sp. UG1 TaxID=3417652 RepID=UPI003CFA77DC